MTDLRDHDIMSSSEAAKRWKKADDYVRQVFRKSPERFPAGTIRKFGKQLVVTRHGMEAATGETEMAAQQVAKLRREPSNRELPVEE